MKRFLITIVALLGVVAAAFNYKTTMMFKDELIGGKTSTGYVSVIDSLGFPYSGGVELNAVNGRILGNLEIQSGLGIFGLVPGEDATEVKITLGIEGEEHDFLFFSTPKKFLESSEEYFLKVVDFAGNVAVKKAETLEEVPVKIGDRVGEGDVIYTSEKSFVQLKDENGNEYYIDENSSVLIKFAKKKEKDFFIKLKVNSGNIVINVIKKLLRSSMILVENSNVTAGVRGTAFSFEVNNDLKVRTFHGDVLLSVMGKKVEIKKGRMIDLPEDFMEGVRKLTKQYLSIKVDYKSLLNMSVEERLRSFDMMANQIFMMFDSKVKKAMARYKFNDLIKPLDIDQEHMLMKMKGFKKKHKYGGNR